MGLFDEPKRPARSKASPFYRVETPEDNQYDFAPGCSVEAVAVGSEAHYVVTGADNKMQAMFPFKSVVCVRLIDDEDFDAIE